MCLSVPFAFPVQYITFQTQLPKVSDFGTRLDMAWQWHDEPGYHNILKLALCHSSLFQKYLILTRWVIALTSSRILYFGDSILDLAQSSCYFCFVYSNFVRTVQYCMATLCCTVLYILYCELSKKPRNHYCTVYCILYYINTLLYPYSISIIQYCTVSLWSYSTLQ